MYIHPKSPSGAYNPPSTHPPHPRPIMPGEVITGRLVLRIFADLLRTIQVFVEARDLPPRSQRGDARARVAPPVVVFVAV